MKRNMLLYLLGWLFSFVLWFWFIHSNVYAHPAEEWECKWIKLNTNFPIIWNCIWTSADSETNPTNAFPYMIWALVKIVMSLIFVVCFILIIYAGILWSSDKPKDARDLLKKVAITILLLWFSWAILRLINPNFFT